jgi:hypothetical protein
MEDRDMREVHTNLSDEKLRLEVSQLVAETGKVPVQMLLWPSLAAALLMSATATVVKLIS